MTATDTPQPRIVQWLTDLADRLDGGPVTEVSYDDLLTVDLATGLVTTGDVQLVGHAIGWPVPPLPADELGRLLDAVRPHAERAAAWFRPSGPIFDETDISRVVDRHLGQIGRLLTDVASAYESAQRGNRVTAAVHEIHPGDEGGE